MGSLSGSENGPRNREADAVAAGKKCGCGELEAASRFRPHEQRPTSFSCWKQPRARLGRNRVGRGSAREIVAACVATKLHQRGHAEAKRATSAASENAQGSISKRTSSGRAVSRPPSSSSDPARASSRLLIRWRHGRRRRDSHPPVYGVLSRRARARRSGGMTS